MLNSEDIKIIKKICKPKKFKTKYELQKFINEYFERTKIEIVIPILDFDLKIHYSFTLVESTIETEINNLQRMAGVIDVEPDTTPFFIQENIELLNLNDIEFNIDNSHIPNLIFKSLDYESMSRWIKDQVSIDEYFTELQSKQVAAWRDITSIAIEIGINENILSINDEIKDDEIKDDKIDYVENILNEKLFEYNERYWIKEEIENYLYKISKIVGTDPFQNDNKLKTCLRLNLFNIDDDEFQKLKYIKQFLRLVHLCGSKTFYLFESFEDIPLGKLYYDGKFEEDQKLKDIILKFINFEKLDPEEIHYIYEIYSNKDIIIGVRMAGVDNDSKETLKVRDNFNMSDEINDGLKAKTFTRITSDFE